MIANPLKNGDFVRVKATSDFRPGQDGLVVDASGDLDVGLVFGYDRHNRHPDTLGVVQTGLTEAWRLSELDLSDVAQ